MTRFLKNGDSPSANKIVEIPMKLGFMPVLKVLGSLVCGTGYFLSAFSDDLASTNRRRFFVVVSAMRDHWLYKYAIRVVTDTREMKARIEDECFGLDVPVVLTERGPCIR